MGAKSWSGFILCLMINRLDDFGGSGQRVVLAHANGYPPDSYRQFIGILTPHFSVQGYRQRALWSKAGPTLWDTRQQAFDFHRAKRPYQGFSDEALWDFIRAGTELTEDGKYRLACSKQWEAHVYYSVPWVWPKLRKIKMPVLGLRGEHTYVVSEKHWARWGRIQAQAKLVECPGGHLLPLEKPESTARVVLEYMVEQGVLRGEDLVETI